mgnify:FL=1|jgi:transcription elongation factor GreA
MDLTIQAGPSLSEALTKFMTAKKNGKGAVLDHSEVGRFVAWCGRERNVLEVTPAQVAEYAQHIGLGGVESVSRLTPVKSFLGYWKDEGWIQNGLAAHLRLPRGRRAAGGGKRVEATASTQLSQEGYDRLVSQVEGLKGERVSVVADIKLAMEDKDFRENAPLDAAKERQGIIESRIRELEASLSNAEILGKGKKISKRTAVGTKVTLKDAESGKKLVYLLVDVREADATLNKISTTSPVGQALLNHVVGDKVTINVPKGTLRYSIEKVG